MSAVSVADESRRVTETPSELTGSIDVTSPVGIARILRGTDHQLFSGWKHHEGLYDDRIIGSFGGGCLGAFSLLLFRL